MGAALYGALLIPLVAWARPALQLRVAVVLVVLALSYPMLRTQDLVPTRLMVSMADVISGDRASSLQFRFDHEQRLLEHANNACSSAGDGGAGAAFTMRSGATSALPTDVGSYDRYVRNILFPGGVRLACNCGLARRLGASDSLSRSANEWIWQRWG